MQHDHDNQQTAPQVADIGRGGNAMELLQADAGSAALAIRSQREIEAALTVAAARPRDEVRAVVRIHVAMRRPGMAADAIYSFPRGRTNVTGPSVALARVLAQAWGNLRYGVDELPAANGLVHLKGWAWDLETNTRVEAEDRFERLIPKSTGRMDATGKKITDWVAPDERDLRELKNRRGAFLIRNCLLQLIPADIVEDALAVARHTSEQAASGDLKARPDDAIRAIVTAFAEFGVGLDAIERRLGHPAREITPEELVDLRRVYRSIRDGQMTRDEAFPRERPSTKGDDQAAEVTARATAALKAASGAPVGASGPAGGTAHGSENGPAGGSVGGTTSAPETEAGTRG